MSATRAARVEALLRKLVALRSARMEKARGEVVMAAVDEAHRERVCALMHVLAITEDADLERVATELGL